MVDTWDKYNTRNMIHLSNLPVLRAVADGPGQTENKTFQLSGQWLPQIREFRLELPAMQMFYLFIQGD